MKGQISIKGILTGFGALVIGLFIVSIIAGATGLESIQNTAMTFASMAFMLIIIGAVIGVASRFR